MSQLTLAQPFQELYRADEPALDMWQLFIPPALSARPSALSHESSGNAPQYTQEHFEKWIEFQRKKGKAVSKDTWTLLVDFIRSIDADFKEYDESGESFLAGSKRVEIVRSEFKCRADSQAHGLRRSTILWNMCEVRKSRYYRRHDLASSAERYRHK